MIVARNLSKTFGVNKVLDNVTFEIQHGSITGLIGHNGAGKTTLMGILCALMRPDEGSVRVGGVDLFSDMEKARSLIGYVPQKTSLYPEMSGRENLHYFGTIIGLSGKALEQSIIDVSVATALEEHLDKRVVHYSGGMQKRLNLAIGLLGNPQILYLDEPTVGVDPETREIILATLSDLAHVQGCTILYTSHYFEEVERICERLIILEHGRVIADDSIANLQNESLERYLQRNGVR
ncbi:MAG: ABC transporter ATP-binding protein [Sulfuricurvum sp.]|uniref:ABC transporter ATP-binding protein n=1 Tax=Sulfuricurvum sp. TaxID=2025608 RepID=UPI00262B4FCA|nr:ABC transporter ATP-binding protein [Sulfuricurvum sp.]MDD2829455.1 ABC transporter ATP-binding protein [Sulfuricurvum sp.]MDD4948462.1 ABC transporter ATP-binding protein [Sulfuricurvum sp.]